MFREHGWGTWERLRASHLETWEFMLGKSIAPILSLALQLVVMLGLGAIIFDLHVSGSIPAFVAVAAMLAVMEVALGFMLLAIFRSTLQLNAATPTTVEFNGRHEGTEHFGLDTARCPFLDHHLDEEFTLTDGTPWHFASVYCGTIDAAGVWSGTGNFTLTSPAGDTLSGHSTSRAQLPTTGVPYRLDIDGHWTVHGRERSVFGRRTPLLGWVRNPSALRHVRLHPDDPGQPSSLTRVRPLRPSSR